MKTISVTDKTKLRLGKYGNMYSTWDSVINELLDHTDKCDQWIGDRN